MKETMIYQIKVTLQHIRPPIWRRILVAGETTLANLHHILQTVMGWEDSHLHQFTIREEYYSALSEYLSDNGDVYDAADFTLAQVVSGEKDKFIYEYDFGDGWRHTILIEKIISSEPKKSYPLCIKGKRACPPEDIGGAWGYEQFTEAMIDPNNSRHDELKDWHGGEFDPKLFDLEAINSKLNAHPHRPQ